MPGEFAGALGASLACLGDRRAEGDPSRTWAPATEQTKTPAIAAAKSWNFEIIPLFPLVLMRLR